MDTNTQPTIWEVSDNVWTVIEPILNKYYPAKTKGIAVLICARC